MVQGERSYIQELCEIFHATNKRVHIKRVEKVLLNHKVCDEYFKPAFTLFCIGTLLCPLYGSYISVAYLFFLADVKNIGNKKWAFFSFYKLMQAIIRHKEKHLNTLMVAYFF